MTTGISPDLGPAARRWAADLLGVREDAPLGEVRRAYLSELRDSEFQPPRSLSHALRILEGKAAAAGQDGQWQLDEEDRLRDDVESFAGEFFSLPVGRRQERWHTLFSRCQWVPPLLARLQSLKPGLEVEVKSFPPHLPFRRQLAEQILESFPLRPLARAAYRQNFLGQIEGPHAAADRLSWEEAAQHLLAHWRALASLDPEFVRQVAQLQSRLKRRGKLHLQAQQQTEAAPAASTGSNWFVRLVLPGLILALLRMAASMSSSPSPSPSPSPKFSRPPEMRNFQGLEDMKFQAVTDPKTGAKSLQLAPDGMAPIQDLLDPAKFDVELVNSTELTILRFTPRPGSKEGGPEGNNGKPLQLGVASLRLMGVSGAQLVELIARAAKEKRRHGIPALPPEEVGPKLPGSSEDGNKRP